MSSQSAVEPEDLVPISEIGAHSEDEDSEESSEEPDARALPVAGAAQTHLAVQDLATLDPERLDWLTPEVISRQATLNIGTIGHVAHGKSTVVKAISGVKTVRFKNELERNITIKLGYANAKIYKLQGADDNFPGNYTSYGSGHPDRFKDERGTWEVGAACVCVSKECGCDGCVQLS